MTNIHKRVPHLRYGLALAALACAPLSAPARAAPSGDPARGAKIFQACSACHALTPNHNMTGPSLAGIFGRKAGTLVSFQRYSKALKSSNVIWNATNLNAWITSPQKFIPGSLMMFPGVANPKVRADLIAYLKQATAPGQAATDHAAGAPGDHDLKKLTAPHKVQAITYCPDTYRITTADGKVQKFWERNLRFQTDSSIIGPNKGAPAIFPAGMQGDRASVIFSAPGEVSSFIKRKCP